MDDEGEAGKGREGRHADRVRGDGKRWATREGNTMTRKGNRMKGMEPEGTRDKDWEGKGSRGRGRTKTGGERRERNKRGRCPKNENGRKKKGETSDKS